MALAPLLSAGVVLIGLVAALAFARPRHLARARSAEATTVTPVG